MDVGGVIGPIVMTVLMDIALRLHFDIVMLSILTSALVYFVTLTCAYRKDIRGKRKP